MKKTIIAGVVSIILFISSLYVLNNILVKEENKYKEHMGDVFILEKDTLTVTDYSILEENFTLSNGKKVNKSLIIKK